MKYFLPALLCCLALAARAEEQPPSIGDRVKSDAKGLGSGVAKAAKTVGRQVGTGTRKTVEGIKTKVKADVKQGTPGDGSARRRNESMDTAKKGRK